jgi:putative transposase
VCKRARLMRDNGLKAHPKCSFKQTTNSHNDCPNAFNILDQDFVCDCPGRKWGVGISCVWTEVGRLYLAIVRDLFSRRIVRCAARQLTHVIARLSQLSHLLTCASITQ